MTKIEFLNFITKWHVLDIVVLALGLGLTFYLWSKYTRTSYTSFLTYIPSIWTSLGIWGTFVSIFLSLTILEFNSLEDINNLVNLVAPAFSTSIMGIMGSLITSICIKIHRAELDVNEEKSYSSALTNIERHVGNLRNNMLEMAGEIGRELLKSASGEMRQVLIGHVEAMAGTMKKTEEVLNKIADKIASDIAGLSASQTAAMKQILEEYRNEAKHVKDTCSEALRQQEEQYTRQVEHMAASQVERIAHLDADLRTAVEGAYGTLTQSLEETSHMIARLQQELSEVSHTFADTRDMYHSMNSGAGNAFGELMRLMDECNRRVAMINAEIENGIALGKASAENVDQILQKAQSVTVDIQNVIKGAATTAMRAAQLVEGVDTRLRSRTANVSVRTKPVGQNAEQTVPGPRNSGFLSSVKRIFTSNKSN